MKEVIRLENRVEGEVLSQETIDELIPTGVHLHKGGFSYGLIDSWVTQNPFLAIWHESQELTKEEIDILKKAMKQICPDGKFRSAGYNFVTIYKESSDEWTFRRMRWNEGPFWRIARVPLIKILEEEFDAQL